MLALLTMTSSAVYAGITFFWTGRHLSCDFLNLFCEAEWNNWENWRFECPAPPSICDVQQYPDDATDNALVEESLTTAVARVTIQLPGPQTTISNFSLTVEPTVVPNQVVSLNVVLRSRDSVSVLDCKTIHIKPIEGNLRLNAFGGVTIRNVP